MRAASRGLLAITLLFAGTPGYTWGPTGHRIVASIAESRLSPRARHAVEDLLGSEGLPRVSTWADEVRSNPEWRHAAPWHYVNIDDGKTYATARKDPRGDIITQMRHFEAVLRDPQARRQDKIVALKFLVHLVGDVHQPLHVGRRGDRGGNEIRVVWLGHPADLHQVWDTLMVDSEKLRLTEFAEFLDHYSKEQVDKWRRSDYLDWVQESFNLRARVYDIGDGRLGYDYAHKNRSLIRLRLAQAGIRLAALLNSIFG